MGFCLRDEVASLQSGNSHRELVKQLSEFESKKLLNSLEEKIAKNYRNILLDDTYGIFKSYVVQLEECNEALQKHYFDILNIGWKEISQQKGKLERQLLEKFVFITGFSFSFANFNKNLNGTKKDSSSSISSSALSPLGITQTKIEILQNLVSFLTAFSEQILHLWDNQLAADKEVFFSTLVKIPNSLMESCELSKNSSLKRILVNVYSVLIRGFPIVVGGLKTFFVQVLNYYEGNGCSEIVGGLFGHLAKQFDSSIILDEFIRTLLQSDNCCASEVSVKNCADFLSLLTKEASKEVLRNLPIICKLLNFDSYSIRCAVLECIGYLFVSEHQQKSSTSRLPSSSNSSLIDENNEEEKGKSTESSLKSLLVILLERVLDVNAFVRGKSLTIISTIAISGLFPANKLDQLWSLASGRLKDKASIVRRKSITLLIDLIRNHPFGFDGGELNIDVFNGKIKQIEEAIEKISLVVEGSEEDCSNQLNTLIIQKKYYYDAIKFSSLVSKTLHYIVDNFMFAQHNKTEVNEAVEFISTCYIYKIANSDSSLRCMLPLVWSKDASGDDENKRSIREHFLNTFRILFFDEKTPCVTIVENFAQFCSKLTPTLFNDCICEIVSVFVERKIVSKQFIYHLWDLFLSTSSSLPRQQSDDGLLIGRTSLAILSMITKGKNSFFVYEKIDVILRKITREDAIIVKYLCKLIQNMTESSMPNDQNVIFDRLIEVVTEYSTAKEWMSVIEQIINTLYSLSQQPSIIGERLIKEVCNSVFISTNQPTIFQLGKLFFVIGHVAVQQSNYLNKVERIIRELNKSLSHSNEPIENEINGFNSDEDASDLIGLVRDREMFFDSKSIFYFCGLLTSHICTGVAKKEYSADSFLAIMATLSLVKFMSISEGYLRENLDLFLTLLTTTDNPIIKNNLSIAFGDFAATYNNIIDQHVFLLYDQLILQCEDINITNDSEIDESMFPVRRNTMMTLSYLILNGMIKVKGQLYQIAICLQDHDKRLANIAKLFFIELASKENVVIYNNILDIISNLSNWKSMNLHKATQQASRTSLQLEFEAIIKFIFSLIKKDKQIENLIEKIIGKLLTCLCDELARDLACCIYLLYITVTGATLSQSTPIINNNSTKDIGGNERILIKIIEHLQIISNSQNSDSSNLNSSTTSLMFHHLKNPIIQRYFHEICQRGKKYINTKERAEALEALLASVNIEAFTSISIADVKFNQNIDDSTEHDAQFTKTKQSALQKKSTDRSLRRK